MNAFMEERGDTLNLTSSGEAWWLALQTQRPRVTAWDGLKLKLFNQKQFMAGSHVLGRYFSHTRVNLYLN